MLHVIYFMTSIIHVWQRRSWLLPSTSESRCRHPAPGQDLIPFQRLHVFAHSRVPHPAIKLWCQVIFTKCKTIFQIEMYSMQCFLKSKYIKSRTFNDKFRWIIKKVMVLKKLLPPLTTRSAYSLGNWRCDEAWYEQTLVYPPVMCQQKLIYGTWELNVMAMMHHVIGRFYFTSSINDSCHNVSPHANITCDNITACGTW